MSEYLHVEKPFLDQLGALGWTVIDQGNQFIPSDPALSLRASFREWMLPEVFRSAIRAINRTADGREWLISRQLDDLRGQLLRHPNRTRLEANEAVQSLFLKAQVDVNELTGESDPVARLIDFAHPERNQFHAINQFRVDTPGCVKSCIIPDIVLFVNGIPLVVVEAKIGDANTANPLHAAFEQLLRYRNARSETAKAGLREEEQLAATAKLIGGKVNVIESTAQLREDLSTDASDVNMVMVHKFMERADTLPLVVAQALTAYSAPPSGESFGVVNHLTEALAIYSSEDAQDIQQGLKNLLTELPILEERYQRLLQHFRAAGVARIEAFAKDTLATPQAEVAVIHSAVGAMKDIKRRADFEV